jgi:hypothetical protein
MASDQAEKQTVLENRSYPSVVEMAPRYVIAVIKLQPSYQMS